MSNQAERIIIEWIASYGFLMKKNVIILGAGMAGLAAGRALAEAGIAVMILEARDHVGGRIRTVRAAGEIFELGAEFIHGSPPELWKIIREAGFRTEELEGQQICYQQGRLMDCGQQWEHNFQAIEQLNEWKGPDRSFADYLAEKNIGEDQRRHLISYVEGFNAADYRQIGIYALAKQQAAEDEIEGDRVFRVCDGYARVPAFVADQVRRHGGKIVLNTVAHSIDWNPGDVHISCTMDGKTESLAADCMVVAVPLGVLQSGAIEFSPEPGDIFQVAKSIRMGSVRRVDLLFRERVWAERKVSDATAHLDDLSFLFAFNELPSTWWTQFPSLNGRLTGWVGGPRSDVFANMISDEVAKKACEALARIFQLPLKQIEALLETSYSYDWLRDRFSMGAYSYLPVGSINAPNRICDPVGGTLYFAGEHTDTTGHWGTVHAALRSGLRAAEQILQG